MLKNKRLKRWTSSMLVLAILLSLLPVWSARAADSFYFQPDILEIQDSRQINTDPTLLTTMAYKTNNRLITISGTYYSVSSDSISVKVEQIVFNSNGTWDVDPQRYFNTGVTVSTTQPRFTSNNLQLFPGYNRITFKGLQGNIEKTETFYIAYNDVPLLTSLKLGSGSSTTVNLNEGASLVVDNRSIYIQGTAQNATRVVVNGYQASVLEDGTFFSPTLNLVDGENDINISLENDTNKLAITRTVYYFNKDQPYLELQVNHAADGAKSILNQVPTLTDDSSYSGTIRGRMLVPYSTIPFFGGDPSVGISVNNQSLAFQETTPGSSEQTITGTDGTPKYKLVDFTTTGSFPFAMDPIDPTKYAEDQAVTVSVYYDNYTADITRHFTFLPGEIAINNVSLIQDFDPASTTKTKITDYNVSSLTNAEVNDKDFYILLDTDKPVTESTSSTVGQKLSAALLPLASANLTITYAGYVDADPNSATYNKFTQAATGTSKLSVYKLSGLPNGSQQVLFSLFDKQTNKPMRSTFKANINYVSNNYVDLESLFDGQTFTFDSSKALGTNQITLKGSFKNFPGQLVTNTTSYAWLYVNGTPFQSIVDDGTNSTDPAQQSQLKFFVKPDNTFNFKKNVGNSQPFIYGENKITITATYLDSTANVERQINKEIHIYIIDSNVATLDKFQPEVIPSTGARADIMNASPSTESLIFKDPSPDISYQDGVYKTNLKSMDLAVKAMGVRKVVLKRGGDVIINETLPTTDKYQSTSASNNVIGNVSYKYQYYAGTKLLYLRAEDLDFSTPGTNVFILELTNDTGAKMSQRIEIDRELAPYRLIAPVPTVGDRVVVNKNFVTIDIEAEGATDVLIGGKAATKGQNNRFTYEYVGLKPQKNNAIKLTINRSNAPAINDTLNVYYADSVDPGAAYMATIASKFSLFNKSLELSFPKNTILKKDSPSYGVAQYYDQAKLRFGIADPKDGVVERVNDYGLIRGKNLPIPDVLMMPFVSEINRENFTRISNVYWISGGIGEKGTEGEVTYLPSRNGLDPYDSTNLFSTYDTDRKLVPTNRGKLTLKFNGSVVDNTSSIITVFMFNDKRQWVNLGGEVNTKNNTVTVPFDDFGYYMVAKLRYGFSDVTNHPWARNVLEGLYSKGIMPNLRYRDFGADDYTTRGEFATLLIKSLNIPLNYDDTNSFLDVIPTSRAIAWDYAHIETAARMGIVTGLSNQIFGPDLRLTREEAAAMIARALELKLAINDAKLESNLAKAFTDSTDMTYYARPSIEAVVKAKIMAGKANTPLPGQKKPTYRFDPKANLTRAEAGQIAIRLLQKSTKIFPKNLN